MKIVICQICGQEVKGSVLLTHLQQKHGWQVKNMAKTPNLKIEERSNEKIHKNETSRLKTEKIKPDSVEQLPLSYKWAIQQKLDKKYKPLITKLTETQNEDSLAKEITYLLTKLSSEPNEPLALKRLVLVSKAKQTLENKRNSISKSSKSKKPKQFDVNIERGFRKVKGVSQCGFCKKKRLECSSCYRNNGDVALICPDCRAKKIRVSHIKKDVKTDAMDYRVSGSYGSSRK
jgi:hypothetical protein